MSQHGLSLIDRHMCYVIVHLFITAKGVVYLYFLNMARGVTFWGLFSSTAP